MRARAARGGAGLGPRRAARCWGAGGSITDGAVTLTYGRQPLGRAPGRRLVGTEPDPATDILYETGWWYRAEGDTREYPFPPPDSETYYSDGQMRGLEQRRRQGLLAPARTCTSSTTRALRGASGRCSWSGTTTPPPRSFAGSTTWTWTWRARVAETAAGAVGQLPQVHGRRRGRALPAGLPAQQHFMVRRIRALRPRSTTRDRPSSTTRACLRARRRHRRLRVPGRLTPALGPLGDVSVSSRLPTDASRAPCGDLTLYPCLLYRDLSADHDGARTCAERPSWDASTCGAWPRASSAWTTSTATSTTRSVTRDSAHGRDRTWTAPRQRSPDRRRSTGGCRPPATSTTTARPTSCGATRPRRSWWSG